MAEPTNTRTVLRRALCQELHMPFIRRTGGESTIASPLSTTTITDAILTQDDDWWNGQWWYSIKNDEVRRIKDFTALSDLLTFEYAATLPVAGDKYEIHSIFNAFELHAAINRALEDAFPSFFDYVTDETLVLKENTLKYDISALTQAPWRVVKVFVEHSDSQISGIATSATASTIVDSKSPFGSVKAGWLVSVYSGTGAGQLRTVKTVTPSTLEVTVNWTTTPDTTSKYMVWNPDSQTMNWEQVVHATFDSKEYPNYLYLLRSFSTSIGLRIRVEYLARPLPLTLESSTSVVPKEFIINKALSFLFGQKVNDNRVDRNRYANLEEYHRQLAEQYRAARAFMIPDATVWQDVKNLVVSSYGVQENPF